MQQVRIDAAGAGMVQPLDPARFSFAKGLLVLKSMPFPEAILELNRWYDVDIRLDDPVLATRRITGEFAADSLSDLTEILELMFKVRVVRSGRVLTLYPR
jgi:ferric-dicitrate binding protein FerR (iron transport regulator)